ncbi:MAG TPA: PxKF domain-containing protein [Patescibacteria group bacterium]|nr:PxKF domain-containing protein [Patescibacteria group bacterium]
MRRSALGAVLLSVALALPASTLAHTSPTWNLDGTYTIPFTCVTGCPSPPDYPYSVTLTGTSDATGAFTGTGYFIEGSGSPAVTVVGQVTGWDVVLHFSYLAPYESYNPWVLTGKIDQNGGMSGTAHDGQGRTFTWRTTAGSVGLFTDRCTFGTYAGYAQVWTGFVPANGGVVTTPPLPTGRSYKLEASGTYFAGGSGLFDIQADAEYSQDAYQRANDLAWTDSVRNYESEGSGLLDLKVNGQFVNWGAFNANHRYAIPVTPTGSPLEISANIHDIYYPNNTGGLCVALFADVVPTGAIISPAHGTSHALGNPLPIEANYYDDNPGSAVFWAVRVDDNESCSYVVDNQVWGNVDGDNDAYTWLPIAGGKQLLSTAPTTGWAAGDYCFVFNPGAGDSVPAGEADVRLISRFTLADTVPPVIALVSALPLPNTAGWGKAAVTLTWSCTDLGGSGVVAATVTQTLSLEGANQSATGTCTDNAGNQASDTQVGIDIDLTAPGITWIGGINDGDSFFFGSVPPAPTCSATDALSGPKSCDVAGYATRVGSHTLTATAFDKADNEKVETRSYTVAPWTLMGFYRPVDMGGVVNVIRGGQTVPLKFEIFAGTTEITSTSAVSRFTTQLVACGSLAGEPEDPIDITTTGRTSLRYDAIEGQFIQNWQTPRGAGLCYRATMTTLDGSSLVAFFKTR